MADILVSENIYQEASLASLNKSNKEFALKLYKESYSIASKMQIYSFLYNITCFKYRAVVNRKCWFDISYLRINKTRVIELGSIDIS